MNSQEFIEFSGAAVDFIANYMDTIRDRPVLPSVDPGYLAELLPSEAPENPESWQEVMKDFNEFIVPGLTHWQSPNFHAFYPVGYSYPSMVGDLLANGLGVMGINWISSPACTELELIMMDWLARCFNLPEHFRASAPGRGGGVLQGSASESILISLIVARESTVKRHMANHPEMTESEVRGKLVAYSSDQGNSCIEKAGILAGMPLKQLKSDKKYTLRGSTLKTAVEEDLAQGLIPCAVLVTLGTTATCAMDNIPEIGPICQEYGVYLHADCAYAGAAFCCEEYSHFREGLEYVDALNINLHKAFLMHYDCTAMWVKDSEQLTRTLSVDRTYLNHKYANVDAKAPDYRNWCISLGRRMRSLKVWFTMRCYGIEQIRQRIRKHAELARKFERLVRLDDRFEVIGEAVLGLVVFRLKTGNESTQELLEDITRNKKIFMVAGNMHGIYAIRFVVAGMNPEKKDVSYAWKHIQETLDSIEGKKVNESNLIVGKMKLKSQSGFLNALLPGYMYKIKNEKNQKMTQN